MVQNGESKSRGLPVLSGRESQVVTNFEQIQVAAAEAVDREFVYIELEASKSLGRQNGQK